MGDRVLNWIEDRSAVALFIETADVMRITTKDKVWVYAVIAACAVFTGWNAVTGNLYAWVAALSLLLSFVLVAVPGFRYSVAIDRSLKKIEEKKTIYGFTVLRKQYQTIDPSLFEISEEISAGGASVPEYILYYGKAVDDERAVVTKGIRISRHYDRARSEDDKKRILDFLNGGPLTSC